MRKIKALTFHYKLGIMSAIMLVCNLAFLTTDTAYATTDQSAGFKVEMLPLSSRGVLFNGQNELLRFRVTGPVGNSIYLQKVKPAINIIRAELLNLEVVDVTENIEQSLSTLDTRNISTNSLSRGVGMDLVASNSVQIGQSRTFVLRGTLTGVSSNSAVSTQLLGDVAPLEEQSLAYITRSANTNFLIWLLNLSSNSGVFKNGYGISGLTAPTPSPTPSPIPPSSQATLTVTRVSPGQYDNTRYSLTIGNHSGIGQYLVVTKNNVLVTQGSPACLNTVQSDTVKLNPDDFPLILTGFDCTSASAVFRTEAVMPPLPDTPPVSNATIAINRVSPGQYDNTRYSLTIGNHSGIGQYLVVTKNNVLVTQGSPACLNTVQSDVLKLNPEDFPLVLTGFDCTRASAVFRAEGVMPPEPFRIISSRADTSMNPDLKAIESQRDFYASFNRPVQNVTRRLFQVSNNVLISDYNYPSYLYQPDQTSFALGTVGSLLSGTEYRYVISGQEIRTGETASAEGTFTIAPAPPPLVKEQVKCVFADSNTTQTCHAIPDDSPFKCSGVGSCVVNVSGEYGTKQTWKSSCGGYAYTTIDGVNEYAEFTKCSPAQRFYADPDNDGYGTSGDYITADQYANPPAGYIRWITGKDNDNCPKVYNPDQKDSNGNGVGDACETPSILVKEQVKCVFANSNTMQKCYIASDDSQFSCSGTDSCTISVSGKDGTKQAWKSTCGGYAYTMIDGVNEYAEFKCAESQPKKSDYLPIPKPVDSVQVLPTLKDEQNLKQLKQSVRSFENYVALVQAKIDRLQKAGISVDPSLAKTMAQAKEVMLAVKEATNSTDVSALAAHMSNVGIALNDALPKLDDLSRLSRALRLITGRIRSAEQAVKITIIAAQRLKIDASEELQSMQANLSDAKTALNDIKSGKADTDDVLVYLQENVLDKLDEVMRAAQRIRLLGSIRQNVKQLDSDTKRYDARIRREEAKGTKMTEAYDLLSQLKANVNELRPLSVQKLTPDTADNIIEYLQTIGDIKDQMNELLGIVSVSPLEQQLEQLFGTSAPERVKPFEVKQFDALVSES